MNKIYKVVWSKVKNCYVVVSEIAKNVITGGVKSAKVGKTPLTNGMALGALMAFVITGSAMAADVSGVNGPYTGSGTETLVYGDGTGISGWRQDVVVKDVAGMVFTDNGIGNDDLTLSTTEGKITLTNVGDITTGNTWAERWFFNALGGDITVTADSVDIYTTKYGVLAQHTYDNKNDVENSGKIDIATTGDINITTGYNTVYVSSMASSDISSSISLKGKNITLETYDWGDGYWYSPAVFVGSNDGCESGNGVILNAEESINITGSTAIIVKKGNVENKAFADITSANISLNAEEYGVNAESFARVSMNSDTIAIDTENESINPIHGISTKNNSEINLDGTSNIAVNNQGTGSAYGVNLENKSTATLGATTITSTSVGGNGFGFRLASGKETKDGVTTYSGNTVTVNGAATITANGENYAQGIYSEYSNVTFKDNVTISATSTGDYAYAVRMLGDTDSEANKFTNSKITFNGGLTNLNAKSEKYAWGIVTSGGNEDAGAYFNGKEVKVDVEAGSQAVGVHAQYGTGAVASSVDTIVDITAKATGGSAYGIATDLYYGDVAGKVDFNGNVSINASGYSAYGVEALNGSSVSLGSAGKSVSITATSTGENGESIAVYAGDNSKVDIIADTLNVNIKNIYDGGSLQAKRGSTITVSANDANVHGIVHASGEGSSVDLSQAKNLKLTSDEFVAYGITPGVEAKKGGKVIIGNEVGKTEIVGDICAHNGGQADIILATAESILNGTTYTKLPEGVPGEDDGNEEGIVNLTLSNTATWNVTGDSTVTTLAGTSGKLEGAEVTVNVTDAFEISDLNVTGVDLEIQKSLTTSTNIKSNSDVTLNAVGNGIGVVDNEVNITAADVVLSTGKSGIEATNGGKVDITATNVTFNTGGQYENSVKGGAIHITNEEGATSVVSIKASENVNLTSKDRYAINNRSKTGGLVEVFGENVTLISENRTAVKAGGHVGNAGLNGVINIGNEDTENITIKGHAQNIYKNTEPNEHKSSIVYAQGGTVNLSATDNIEITNTGNNVGKTIAVYDGGTVNVKDADNLVIDGEVYATGDGSVSITDVGNVSITSIKGSAINNASHGSVISIGNETTKNITITGATEGSREVYDGQGNFVNYNEDNRAVIYSKGTVNIIANEKVVINDTGVKTKAVSAYGDANVTIDGGKETIINGEITADGYGPVRQSDGNVEHQDNGIADDINVVIKGKDIVVDASLEAEEGVFARGDSTGIDNAVIIVGDANTEKVTVRDVDTGLFAWNGGSKVEVNSDSLVISADGNFKDSGMGICAINSSDANNKLAIVDVNAGKTEITVKDGAFAYGIYANGKSNVDVAGNIDIVANGTSAFGVEADKSATVVLGDSNSTVTFDVNADELDYEGESRAEALHAHNDSVIEINGNMDATVNGRDWVSGVESTRGSDIELGNVTLNVSTNGSEFSEASGINVARKGSVIVNDNLEATVTGGEWASGVEAYNGSNINIGNGSSEVKLTATTNGTESSDKDWEVSAFGILSVGQTKPIIADNEEDNEYAYGGSTVNINASQLTIDATSSYGEAYGIYVADAGVVNVQNATNAEINGKVFATGEGSQVNFTNSGDVNITETKEHGIAVNNGGKVDVTAENVTIDSLKAAIWMEKNSGEESKSEVHITANGDVELTSKDRFAINNESKNYGVIDVSGKDITIISKNMPAIKVGESVVSEGYNGIVNVTGENITLEGSSHEIVEGWEQRASVVYTERGTINLSATDALTITDTANIGGNAVGAYSGGSVNIKNAASVAIDGSVYATGEGTKVNIVDVKDVKITSTKGSAINNASNNSVVEIGSENTETVTINGATEELQQVFGESNNLISYNEDNRAVVFTRGDVNIIATEKVEITDTNEGKAIDAHGGANVIIDGGKETVINGEVYADGHEYVLQDDGDIEHQDSGKGENINVTILGKDITADAKGGEGVFARGDSVGGDNAVITVGDANTENITINNTTIGLFAWYDGSKVEVNGDSLEINAKGTEEDAGVGIYASNNGAVHNNPATVDVNSVQTKITVNDSGSECVGVWADSYGVVNVNGDLEVNAKNAVMATDGGNVNVNNAIDVELNGEVYATGKDSKVNFTDVGSVNITETKEHGISVNNGGKVDIVAENVTIDSYKAAIWLDDLGDNAVTIKANENVNLTSEDRFAVNNESIEGSLIDISGKNVVVTSEDRTAVKAGGTIGKEGKNGTVNISGETVSIQGFAQNTVVDGKANEHNASVVYAQGKGVVNLSAANTLTITDTAKVGGNAVSVYEGGTINIKDTANLVVDGAVYANGEGSRVNIEANKGSVNGNVEAEDNASIVVTLESKEASFTGATKVTNAEKGVTLNLQQGATWYVTGDSTVSSVIGDNFNITKASNVGVNEEVTVTLDGKHADGMHDDFESTTTNIYGVDLVIREKNESGLGGTVTLNSDSDITVEGAHHAIHTNGNDVVNITTDKLTLVNGTGFDAIRAENGGKVNIDADDVALTSKVYTNGDGSIVDIAGVNNVLITSTNGSAINNASDGATIKIGDEGTKTVAITGATEGSREVYDNQGNFVNYNEDNRAVIYSKGTVNINANEKVVISDTGVKTKALSAYGDANVTIDGGEQTIINGEITADGYGPVMQIDGNVEHQDNGIADNINVVIKGKDIVVDASLEAEEGVFARGDSTGIDNAVIIVGDTNTEKVTVRDVDTGLFAWNGGSKVEVNSDSLVISADGNFKDSGMGICAINSSDANNKLAIVKVNAGETKITVDDGAFAYGIYANGKSNVDVTGNINIATNGISAFGVEADKSATVVLGDNNSTVTFDVNADVLDYEGESRAEAIAARENNFVTVLGNMNATVNGRDWVSGVESEDGSVVELGNVTLNVSTDGNEFSEASGINVAREGAVKVNGNLEATVTGGEWASGVEAYNGSNINIGNGSSEVKLTATAKGTESSDKDWGVSAFGILSVGQTKPIIADNEEDSEEAHGGSIVNINASQLTINATSSYGKAYGIYTADAGVVNIENATDAEINGKVFATGESSQVNFTNSGDVNITESKEHGIAVNNGGKVDIAAKNVTIDSYKAAIWMEKNSGEESKSEVHITANGDVELTSEDRFAINNESQNNGIVKVSGKDVTIISEKMPAIKVGERVYSEGYNGIINVTGETITIEGAAHDVIADWEQRAYAVYAEGGNINLNATTEIKITDTAKVGGNAIGAYNAAVINVGNVAVEINGNVYANGEYSKVNIEATKGSINGNLEAEDNASVVVTLKSKEASFTGATKVTNAEKGVTLNLQQGATWNVTGDSTVSSVIGDNFNITRATSVKPEDEVTIILDGRHTDGIKDDYESTKSTITGVDLVLHEDNGLNGNQTIISDSDVTLHSEGNGINVVDGNYVSIQAAEFTLNQGTGFDAIRAENGGKVNIAADNAVFNGSVYASGVGSEVDFYDTENVTVDGTYSVVKVIDNAIVKAGNITLTGNDEDGKVEAIGVNKGNFVATGNVSVSASGYSAYGVEAVAGSTVEIGASDKDVTFVITSNGTDNAEAQAITAEGGSKVTVNANKLGITTTAKSKVTGSLQARDKDSEIIVKATDVDVTGDIFAGEGAKVAINTTNFAAKGNIGSEGVIDITTGDVAYGAGTQFYTEGSGAINLAGGNVSGVLNIAKGNVNLTGATFTVANLNDAIKGAGKLVVDGSGVLKTTADQVFTVGDAETVDVETLGKNGINDIAKEKVTFKSGSLSLSDDYSYDYLTSITDVMKEDNGNATKLVMTGTLKNATSINPDDIETDENNQLDVNDASNLGSDVHLDNVTVKTDNNLLIGGSASKDTPVEVDGVKATDSVANGFSADGLDLGNADGAIIAGGKEVTLGGSNGNDKIVSSTVESTTLVVGTGGDEPDAKGTLNIGTNNDADYKHHGKVHVNHGSDLNAKGKTKITGGVELEGGNLNVDEKGHLEADIVVESKKGNGNNGNNGNGNGNNKDKDKVTITGKVTGNLTVNNNKEEGHPSTMIHLGNDKVAGKLHAKEVELNGATLFLDPQTANNISEASMFTLEAGVALDKIIVDGNIIAGQNSVAAFGVSGANEVEEAFAKTGLSFGNTGDVDSVVYIAKAIDVNNGSIIANGTLTQAPDSYTNGEVEFAANSLLIVDAEDVKAGPVIKGVKNVNIVQPDVQNNIVGAKLYIDDVNIDDAQKGTKYTIFEELNGVGVNASWAAENISTNNQLIKFTDASIVNGKLELKADGVQKVNDVYKGEIVAGEVVDKAIDTNSSSADFFNSAVDQKVNVDKASQVDGVNSSLAINEVAGVTHTTYAVSNILTDAVADHMSLANGKEHDKDIWAHYVHTKEDVDGLKYDVHSTKYSAQYNGIVVGTDLYKEGKATVGAALTYIDGNINGSSVATRTENDAKYYGASIYGSIQNNDTAVIADVSYIHSEHDITQRNSGKVITSEPETDAFSVGVRVEKEAKAGIGKLVPYAGLRYMHLGTGNYTNSIGLAYDADDAELFLLPVGLKYSADIKNTNGWTMRPVVEFGYVWAFGDTDADQTVSLNGESNGFGYDYDVTDSGSYVGRFMLEAEKANISYALGYEYQKGDNVEADKWMVNVNWKF